MTATSYVALGETTSPKFCRAFALGCNGDVVTNAVMQPGPVAMFGSPQLWHILKQALAENRDVYYGDHAYFYRFKYYRICRNRFQSDGIHGQVITNRLNDLGIKIEPWNRRGAHILLCPPDPYYANREGFDDKEWTTNIIDTIKQHSDREIRIRHRIGAEKNPVTLRDDLKNAHCLVTHHSNAAVEALCMGYPTFVTGECAARAMSGTDLSKIETPFFSTKRLRWATLLASNQWTLDEIRQGIAWRMMQ